MDQYRSEQRFGADEESVRANPVELLVERLLQSIVSAVPSVAGRVGSKLAMTMAVNLATDAIIARSPSAARSLPARCNTLICGNPRSAETLVRAMAETARLPCHVVSAAFYSSAGYVGHSDAELATGLLTAAGRDIARAERAVVLITNVDAIRRRDFGGQDDVGGIGVQHMFSAVLRGTSILTSRGASEDRVTLNTSRMKFFGCGEFPDLVDTIRRRNRHGHDVENSRPIGEAQAAHLHVDDLVGCRLDPGFVRLFTTRVLLPDETGQAAVQTQLENRSAGAAGQLASLFERLFGKTLEFDPRHSTEISALVQEQEGEQGDAQATLFDLACRSIGHQTRKAIVDRGCVTSGLPPWEVPGEPDPYDDALDRLLALLDPGTLEAGPGRSRPVRGKADEAGGGAASVRSRLPHDRMRARIEAVKRVYLDWDGAHGAARQWWESFEKANNSRPDLVLKLAEALRRRRASIADYYLAYRATNSAGVQEALSYLDRTHRPQPAGPASEHSGAADDSPHSDDSDQAPEAPRRGNRARRRPNRGAPSGDDAPETPPEGAPPF